MTNLRVRFYKTDAEELWEGPVDGIVQRSVLLKKLIAQSGGEGGIRLEVPATAEIEDHALKYFLENLQANSVVYLGSVDVESLSTQCYCLWMYECNPESFKELLEGRQPSQSHLSTTDYCWHQPTNSSPTLTSSEQINVNIAWVLAEDRVLREEIKKAVWNSNSTLLTSVVELQNIQHTREEQMKFVVEYLAGIWGEHAKLAHTLREGLKKKGKGDLSQGWEGMSDSLEGVTIYEFLEMIEEILLGPRSYPQYESTTYSPRELPSIEFPWLSKLLHKLGGRQAIEDLLDNVNKRIIKEQKTLTDDWIRKRKSTLETWRLALLDNSNGTV